MAASVLITAALIILMAKRLLDMCAGEHYICPSCGARSARGHSADCPWSPPPSRLTRSMVQRCRTLSVKGI
jgi:hypothetical protein